MKRCFIATKDSEYTKDYQKYRELEMVQNNFIKGFFNEKGIESTSYILSGDGFCNVPFKENSKSNISLSIQPTENDIAKYGKLLSKPNKHHGLCSFKKNSNIAKEFAQKCIDEKIIINLLKPRVGDYFKNLNYRGYSISQFYHNDNFYIKLESDFLEENDTPEGFTEFKLSEYYKMKEELGI